MEQIWLNSEATWYYIGKDGRLFSEKTNRFYKGSIRNGYRWFDLRWKSKKYVKSQHRLLAEAFIPNPFNKPYVHHKDGNRLNNSLENLQWVTPSENNLAITRTESGIDHSFTIANAEKYEQWVTYRNTIYMVSDYGRVKNVMTGKVLQGKITLGGYREYCLTLNGRKCSVRAHRLVWEGFHREIPNVINHINGNKLDNRLSNLESVTYSENVLKAIYETKTLCFPKTIQIDDEGNIIQVYHNNADAARAMGVRPQSIQAAISKGNKSCGYYWKNLN